jgi:phospholipid/cholesterol/gamma-HCH transport system permease protein
MAIMVPCLAVWSDLMGVLGGCSFGISGGGFSVLGYFTATRDALVVGDVVTGILKSFVFGLIITAVGCQAGFSTGAGAEEVGRSTTTAVVLSIFMVILVDVVFTALFYLTGGLT